jgi:two-component system response regulator YesN
VSAYESSEFRNRAEQLGAQRFLSKPVDFNALGEALKADLNLNF